MGVSERIVVKRCPRHGGVTATWWGVGVGRTEEQEWCSGCDSAVERVEYVRTDLGAVSGEQLYEAWRASMNRAADRRGNHREPRWKDVKPWLKRVWDEAAATNTGAVSTDGAGSGNAASVPRQFSGAADEEDRDG
jgi:hypothetical protein